MDREPLAGTASWRPLRAVAETEDTDADTDDKSDEADEPAEPVIAVMDDCTEATDDSTEDIDCTAELASEVEGWLCRDSCAVAKAARRERMLMVVCCFILGCVLE